jgi:hypothetical protein
MERQRALFKKYGIQFDPKEWSVYEMPEVKRVEKPIRMRIHRTCHLCDATFVNSDHNCPSCSHLRCKKCPRFPKKEKDNSTKKPEILKAVDDTNQYNYTGAGRYKVPKQRIRRSCHQCAADLGRDKTCVQCGHVRCTRCPRDPYVSGLKVIRL